MNTKKTATTTNYSCYHFSGKTGKIAKQRLSAMQHSDKKNSVLLLQTNQIKFSSYSFFNKDNIRTAPNMPARPIKSTN